MEHDDIETRARRLYESEHAGRAPIELSAHYPAWDTLSEIDRRTYIRRAAAPDTTPRGFTISHDGTPRFSGFPIL